MSFSPAMGEYLYRRLKAAQRAFGMARLELGAMLETFRTNPELWKGRASSFPAFLEEERIQSNGASQFMKVAKAFVFDHALSNDELEEIATANFRILSLAAKIITKENRDDVIALLAVLGERDARAALIEMGANGQDGENGGSDFTPRPAAPVNALMRKFRELPDDQRLEFLGQLAPKKGVAQTHARAQ